MKSQEEIQEHQFRQRINILKGFKEVSGLMPTPIEDLKKSLDGKPFWDIDGLTKYADDVLKKGSEDDIQKAKEQISNLDGLQIVDERGLIQTVFFEKGHMDFGGKGNLVKKQITDKTGKQTSKWVNPNKDDKKGENNPAAPEDKETTDKTSVAPEATATAGEAKTPEMHAKDTSSEDLKAYLEKNPDGEHAEHAKAELEARGESVDGDENSVDYTDGESVKMALESHPQKDKIVEMSIDNGITIGQAMKMVDSSDVDHSETHAAIDQAQAALDGLKDKTGHPGTQIDSEFKDFSTDELYDLMSETFDSENWTDEMQAMKDEWDSREDKGQDEDWMIPNSDAGETGKTTEDTKDLIDEHEKLVDTLDSDSNEDDKQEADKQRGELKDLKDKQDHDGKDDDGDGQDEDDSDDDGSESDEEEDDEEDFGGDDDEEEEDEDDLRLDGTDNSDDVLASYKNGKISEDDVLKHFSAKK